MLAFEPGVRPLSKKQKKRKTTERDSKKHNDPRVVKKKKEFIAKQVSSPETQSYIEKMYQRMMSAVQRAVLPDHLHDEIELNSDGRIKSRADEKVVDYEKIHDQLFEYCVKHEKVDESVQKGLLQLGIDSSTANSALIHYCTQDLRKVENIFHMMSDLGIEISSDSYKAMIEQCTAKKLFAKAERLFDKYVEMGKNPSPGMWEAKVVNIARSGRPDDALKVVDQLEKAAIPITCKMLTEILEILSLRARFDDAYNVWERMHHEPVELDARAFSVMIRNCSMQRMVERAFFYFDELKCIGLEPTLEVFHSLFRACSTASHWINGYQNIIFEAMDKMEAAEMLPTVETYNSIIYAFSEASDAVAAEYYFWEMKRKGFTPNLDTYAYVLRALARAQNVGAVSYSNYGRYCRPSPQPPSEEEQAMLDIGPVEVSKMKSERIITTFDPQPGKRGKPKYEDIQEGEFDPDLDDNMTQLFLDRAKEIRGESMGDQFGGLGSAEDDDDADDGFEGLDELKELESDPSLRKLIEEVKQKKEEEAAEALRAKASIKKEAKPGKDAELRIMRKILSATEGEFEDPFAHMEDSITTKIEDSGSQFKLSSAERSDLVMLLDEVANKKKPKINKSSPLQSLAQSQQENMLSDSYIDSKWNEVTFGRAPDTDFHLVPLKVRRKQNTRRAELLFDHLLKEGVKPNTKILNEMFAVYSEAGNVEMALDMLAKYPQFNCPMTERTYRYKIMMYIRMKDIEAAVQVKEEMKQNQIIPHSDSYGYIIESYVHRNMLVEALQTLEEAKSYNVSLAEKHLRQLRTRCEKLKIVHPDVPPDPLKWAKESKANRRRHRDSPQSTIEQINSRSYV